MEDEEDEEEVWVCNACTFRNQAACQACAMCYTVRTGLLWLFQRYGNSLSICSVQRFLTNMLSRALTGVCALLGAFTGAVTGALAGRAAQSGLLRGAGLGAVAGAVLSVEVLEALRSCWHLERSGASASPSMIDFIEDLLSGRLVQEFVVPAVLATQRWQLNIAEMSFEELYAMFIPAEGRVKGASEEFLQCLPKHIVTQGNRVDASGDVICCAICLQELEEGAIARTLQSCKHTFHLNCVDQWLVKRVICPVCRQYM